MLEAKENITTNLHMSSDFLPHPEPSHPILKDGLSSIGSLVPRSQQNTYEFGLCPTASRENDSSVLNTTLTSTNTSQKSYGENLSKLTLEMFMNNNYYNKYLSSSDPLAYREQQDFLDNITKHKQAILDLTKQLLDKPKMQVTTPVLETFKQYMAASIKYIEHCEFEARSSSASENIGSEWSDGESDHERLFDLSDLSDIEGGEGGEGGEGDVKLGLCKKKEDVYIQEPDMEIFTKNNSDITMSVCDEEEHSTCSQTSSLLCSANGRKLNNEAPSNSYVYSKSVWGPAIKKTKQGSDKNVSTKPIGEKIWGDIRAFAFTTLKK